MNRLAVLAGGGVLLLLLLPVITPGIGSWGSADGAGMLAVQDNQPEYEPWFQAVWTPPSGKTESVLFSLQAAIGAGIIGYVFHAYRET